MDEGALREPGAAKQKDKLDEAVRAYQGIQESKAQFSHRCGGVATQEKPRTKEGSQ